MQYIIHAVSLSWLDYGYPHTYAADVIYKSSLQVGFADVRVLEKAEIIVTDPKLADICGEARFFSITYRLFKLPDMLETICEDYGQYAIYKGTIPGHPNSYVLDDHHKGRSINDVRKNLGFGSSHFCAYVTDLPCQIQTASLTSIDWVIASPIRAHYQCGRYLWTTT